MSKTAVIYARVSVASEESVSVARQLASGRRYAEARGWAVVGEFVDDGVSATANKPDDREGWRGVLTSSAWFDAVIVWKVDRLARRVIDFLRADETLRGRGAAIVCVEQSIDMTTSEGRAFAQMLAVFGELEAAAISARVVAARTHLIQSGRVAGGGLPYGYRSVPNPNGPGLVLAQHPDRIEWVRGIAERAVVGERVTSIARWLNAVGAPLPPGREAVRKQKQWGYSSVRSILENPILAGQVRFTPSDRRKGRFLDVLRDKAGEPVVRPELAVMSVADHERLLARFEVSRQKYLDAREIRAAERPVLAGLAQCGGCRRELPMNHGFAGAEPVLRCPACRNHIAVRQLSAYIEYRMVSERGELTVHRRQHVDETSRPHPYDAGAELKLVQVERALAHAAQRLTHDDADTKAITKQLAGLRRDRAQLRQAQVPPAAPVLVPTGLTLADLWRMCADNEQRRRVFSGQLQRLTIHRGRGTRYLDPTRVQLAWRAGGEVVGPADIVANQPQPLRLPPEWISFREAMVLAGRPEGHLRRAVVVGEVEQRPNASRGRPSLRRSSVIDWIKRSE